MDVETASKHSEVAEKITSSAISDRLDVARFVRDGLDQSAANDLAEEFGISLASMTEIGLLPKRTWSHAQKTGHFSPQNTQRMVRYLRAIANAREVFGADKAEEWLHRPTAKLDGEAPVSLLDTDDGARAVEILLGRISHGIGA